VGKITSLRVDPGRFVCRNCSNDNIY